MDVIYAGMLQIVCTHFLPGTNYKSHALGYEESRITEYIEAAEIFL